MFPSNLVDHFVALARDRTGRDAVTVVGFRADDSVSESISYADLDRAARSVAVWLMSRCTESDRVLLLYPTSLEFVRAFWGCLYAGLVPVPAPVPVQGSSKHHLMRATGVALDSDARLVLTDSRSLVAVSDWITQDGLDDLTCVATDHIALDDPGVWIQPVGIGPDTLALLLYTSGSTSDPKGVMITHGNLMHNLKFIQRIFGLTEADRFCSWLPLFQDIGLVGLLLTPLFLGGTVVLMQPGDFATRPYRWFELIDHYDIQFSSAPSCAYDFCVYRVSDEQIARLDLTRWRNVYFNGSDPVDEVILSRFVTRFAPAGLRRSVLRVGYGVTEATLLATGSGSSREPIVARFDARSLSSGVLVSATSDAPARLLVSSGPLGDLDLRIVDPQTAEVLTDGQLGEVWIRGDSVAKGYWRKEAETKQTFNAVTATGEAGFLRTGDLGGLQGEQLYILGRIDEVLVVHGRHLYPSDIEQQIRLFDNSFAGLSGSVFTVPTPLPEIVVVHELRAKADTQDLAVFAGCIRQMLGRQLGIPVENVVLVAPGKVRRTVTGRVNHSLMRELFVADALAPVYEHLGVKTRRRYRSRLSTADLLSPGYL